MAEPARKITPDIEPAIRPDLRVVQGGGQTTPDRASLAELEKQESNPGQVDKNGDLKDKEENAPEQAGWEDKTKEDQGGRQYTDGNGKKHSAKKGFGFMKKKGPMALLFGGVLGGGSIIAMLSSPALLIVNMKEVMVGKFNSQLTGMEIRTNRKLFNKNYGVAKCSVAGMLCRYTSLSKSQLARLKKAGLDITGESNTFGRVKPTKVKYNGVDLDAEAFRKAVLNDPDFRIRVKKGYNPKFAGFADSIWSKASRKLGLTKARIRFKGDTPDAKLADIQTRLKGTNFDNIKAKLKTDGSGNLLDDSGNIIKDSSGKPIKASSLTPDDLATTGSRLGKHADDIMRQSDNILKEAGEGAIKSVDDITRVTGKGAKNLIKITGVIDNLCLAYNLVRAVGFAAKVVRAGQLASYAFMFFNIADQIKAGDSPDPEDVSYLGDILTKELIASTTAATTRTIRAATDSFGYKYAAYGEYNKSLTSIFTSQFLAGGGLTGQLIGITSQIKNSVGGLPGGTCKVLANPLVGAVSAIVGIGVAIATSTGSIWATMVTSLASPGTIASLTLVAANLFLPSLLADLIAGKVIGEGTFGELAGDAITSGAGTLTGHTAKYGGASPLTPEQAAAYTMKSREIAEIYAQEERVALSPFDISSSNTFLGKFVHSLVPYLGISSSPAKILQSIGQIAISSLRIASSLNITRAVDAEEFKQCEDEDYETLGIATDPFCNVFYGTPVNELESENNDPIKVLERVASHIYMTDAELEGDAKIGDPKSKEFKDFIEDCIERENPLGFNGDSGDEDDGKKCLFSQDNKDFYLYWIDKRIEDGMSGDDETLNAATEFGYISFYDPADNIDNIADEEHEETSYNDYIDDEGGIEIEVSIPELTDQICSITSPKGPISPILGWLYGRQNFNQTKQETILS